MSEETHNATGPFSPEVVAKLEKMQQIQFWAIFMEPQSSWDLGGAGVRAVMLRHIEWLERMEFEGRLVLSGPLGLPDWDGTGMAVIRADDMGAARALAESEPFHLQGLRKNRVVSWNVNEGTLFLRVDIFSGKGCLS